MDRSLRALCPTVVFAFGCGVVHQAGESTDSIWERAEAGPWLEEQKLVPSDGGATDYFGGSIALEGDTALVSAYGHSDDAGAVYVFSREGGSFVERQVLAASDGGEGDRFGGSVSISGDTAVVGAPLHDAFGDASGAAYVFVRSGSSWTEQQKLLPSDGAPGAGFGGVVAVSRDTVFVSASRDEAQGYESGAVYVYQRRGSTWTEQQKLLAADGGKGRRFGRGVAVSGNVAFIGVLAYDWVAPPPPPGLVYVFEHDGTTWIERQRLLLPDGPSADGFGGSIALSGNTAIIGAPGDDDSGTESGTATVFVRAGTLWVEQQKLAVNDGVTGGDYFGSPVALLGDRAVIGATGDDDGGSSSGAAYVFERIGTAWTEQKKILASDAAPEDAFGSDIALGNDVALVGATGQDPLAPWSGAAYAFRLTGGADAGAADGSVADAGAIDAGEMDGGEADGGSPDSDRGDCVLNGESCETTTAAGHEPGCSCRAGTLARGGAEAIAWALVLALLERRRRRVSR